MPPAGNVSVAGAEPARMADGYTDSMCGVWAELIRAELASDDPDEKEIERLLSWIETYCQTVGYAPGEVPEPLADDGE